MKITKFSHACLLVETEKAVALFDPGGFSEDLLKTAKIDKLDYIVITHTHFDHFSFSAVQALVKKFPKVCIVSTPEVMEQLTKQGIGKFGDCKSDEIIQAFDWPHESMEPLTPDAELSENIGVHFVGLLTHPGDSHHVSESKAVLAVPMDAPWGITVQAIALARDLKPQYVVPIHDAMWNDGWRDYIYGSSEKFFEGQGIKFLNLKDGEPVEIAVE